MKKIIIHWSAGSYKPNKIDLDHYHFLVDNLGNVFDGNFIPEDNVNCNDGKYAQHTGGGNTGAIGIAFCGMAGFVSPNNMGHYPLTKIQCESLFKFSSQLCKKYNIPIDQDHVLTHYEFGKNNPKTSSFGKIDIIFLPPYPNISKNSIGNFIRNKINWYFQHI